VGWVLSEIDYLNMHVSAVSKWRLCSVMSFHFGVTLTVLYTLYFSEYCIHILFAYGDSDENVKYLV
jgi:hypothetical protein